MNTPTTATPTLPNRPVVWSRTVGRDLAALFESYDIDLRTADRELAISDAELANCRAAIAELQSENATLLMWATSLERELEQARGEPDSRA